MFIALSHTEAAIDLVRSKFADYQSLNRSNKGEAITLQNISTFDYTILISILPKHTLFYNKLIFIKNITHIKGWKVA